MISELTETERKIKAFTLAGATQKEMASRCGICERQVRRTIKTLEDKGHLIHIPGTKSPRAFIDGFSYNAGTSSGCPVQYPGYDEGGHFEDEKGMVSEKGVRLHFSGSFTVGVEQVGNLNRFMDPSGFTIGGVTKSWVTNGDTKHYGGYVIVRGEPVKFQFTTDKDSNPQAMNLYPGEVSAYYKTVETVGKDQLRDRVDTALNVMRNHGWKFVGTPAENGVFHYGGISESLLKFTDFGADRFDGERVFADRSHGHPEIEISDESPTAQADLIELWELPSRLRAVESYCVTSVQTMEVCFASQKAEIEQLKANQAQIGNILKLIQESQTRILETMLGVGNPNNTEGYA